MQAYPNLRHIRLLMYALTHSSLSKAAEIVGISQPAASQAISRLEQNFGGQLFERGGAGLAATDRGRIVSARADRVVQLLRTATESLGRHGRRKQPPAPDHLERHVTIVQLRALSAFARTGSFSAAARQLDQAEPSVQRAARELERVAGVAIFEGRQQSVALTPSGKMLGISASLVLRELESAVEEVAELEGRFDGKVVVGTLPLVRSRIIPKAIASWTERRPAASMEVRDGPYDLLIHSLAMGEIDMLVGALRESPAPRGLIQETLFDDGLSIVGRAGHPLMTSPAPRFADLSSYAWILPRKGTPTRAIFDALAAEHGIETGKAGLIETASLVAARGIMLETDRLTLLSRRQIVHEEKAGILAVIPLELSGTERPIGISIRKGWKPTVLQSEFLQALREAAAE